MNINTGKITELDVESVNKLIPEHLVMVPSTTKVQHVMTGWGEKKRQRYAHLVKNEKYSLHEAFYFVEFNNGKVIGEKDAH